MSEESSSERELSPEAPVLTAPPTKKLKQRTLSFVPALASPSAASSTSDSSLSVSVSQDINESAGSTGITTCTSDCCKGGLVPHQPTETGELQLLQRKQGQTEIPPVFSLVVLYLSLDNCVHYKR